MEVSWYESNPTSDVHFAALEAIAALKWSNTEKKWGVFMKNELFSTLEKKKNSNKTQFCSKSSILDPRRTNKVETGQVRPFRGSKRPLKSTCQSDTPHILQS